MQLTEEQIEHILDLAVEGLPIHHIAQRAGIPVGKLRYLVDTDYNNLALRYARARDLGFDVMTDRLLTITEEEPDIYKARLVSDNVKWIAAKRKPKVYGDKVDVSVTHTVDISSALTEARQRALNRVNSAPVDNLKITQRTELIDLIDTTRTGLEPANATKQLNAAPIAAKTALKSTGMGRHCADTAKPNQSPSSCNASRPNPLKIDLNIFEPNEPNSAPQAANPADNSIEIDIFS